MKKIFLVFTILCATFLLSCDEVIEKKLPEELFEIINEETNKHLFLNDEFKLTIPKTDNVVSYSISDNDYIVNSIVTSTATVEKKVIVDVVIDNVPFEMPIYIYPNLEDYAKKVESYIKDYIKTETRTDLRLYTTYGKCENIIINYTSSNQDILENDGTYIGDFPDTIVTMTVDIIILDYKYSFDIDILVKGASDTDKIAKAKETLDAYIEETVFTEDLQLPVTDEYLGGRISWISNDPGIIRENSVISLPDTEGSYVIRAFILFGSVEEEVEYTVHLNKRTVEDVENDMNQYLEDIYSNKLDNRVVSLYDGKAPIITEALISPSDAFYSSMHGGLKPSVSQAVLDKLFYEGYQMPNNDNVLWIVVHETGNTNVGKDAKVHSDMQLSRSQNGFGGSTLTSWHFTVDDHSIYQNLPEELVGWHAGDGRAVAGGNTNGIGIEMCTNADGDFELSLKNNAKLIAYLLHKYNLTIANVKQHYDFSSYNKNCPETIRNTKRWTEFLDMISREYIFMELFNGKEVSYEVVTEGIKTPLHTVLFEKEEVMQNVEIILTIDSIKYNYTIKFNEEE